jgi:diguanylate cyclase (GGDEF)-like protein
MHRLSWLTVLPALLLLPSCAAAEGHPDSDAAIALDPLRPTIALGGHWLSFQDPSGELGIDLVGSPEFQHRFRRVWANYLNLGFSDAALWLRIDLFDPGPDPRDWVLEFRYPLLDDVRVYRSDAAGGWSTLRMGDHLPFAQRPLPHRNFLVPLRLSVGEVEHLFVRVSTDSSMQIRLHLHPALEFFLQTNREEVLYGSVYGIMLMMTLYNGFLFLAVRDPAYLAYVLAVLAGGAFLMAMNGHAYQYLWPTFPQWANLVLPLSSSLWIFGTAIFTQLFLDTKRYAPGLHRVVDLMILVSFGAVLLSLWSEYRLAIRVSTVLGLVNGGLILTTSAVCWLRGNRAARFFTLAWIVYAAGTTGLILNRMGLLPYNLLTQHSATLGLLVEIVVLSMALSDKYRLMTKQLLGHSLALEAKVAERTAELESANRKLRDLAQRDSLTQLANRRFFDHTLGAEWERHRRDRDPIALLLIDVDNFKGYNDHFGHRAGDRCLQAVAEALARTLRRPADLAARYGGDEFAAVLPQTDLDGALVVAERLRRTVRQLSLPHAPGSQHPVVTLSIGAACLVPIGERCPEALVEGADAALYRAKDRGRDQAVG